LQLQKTTDWTAPVITTDIKTCDKNFRLKLVTLKTELFPRPHTMSRVKKSILDTLAEFNLENKNIIAVTDSGSDVVAGCRLAGLKRLSCSCHTVLFFQYWNIGKTKVLFGENKTKLILFITKPSS
jgi:hypothetical protein